VRVLVVMASADGKIRTVEEEQEEEGVEDVVEIKENPLDIMRYIDAVRDSSAGAIATFSGTTRDTFEGQEVLELRYEAHKSMAYRELRRICQAAREQWDLKRIAVAHRTGVVTIGQESVFIAVSSIHRQDALQACQFVIDEIKARVPIWKKEIYNNGEAWKQNPEFLTRNAT
jgi:molybdopterin synthase catalytic subunit